MGGLTWECGEGEMFSLRSAIFFCEGPNSNILVFGGYTRSVLYTLICLFASPPFKIVNTILHW